MCCPTVTVDGQELKLDNGWYEDSWTYPCSIGGSVSVLWQLYRPLLGNTVEIVTGESPILRPIVVALPRLHTISTVILPDDVNDT